MLVCANNRVVHINYYSIYVRVCTCAVLTICRCNNCMACLHSFISKQKVKVQLFKCKPTHKHTHTHTTPCIYRHNKLTLVSLRKKTTLIPSYLHTNTNLTTYTTVDLSSDRVTRRPDYMTSQGSGNFPVILNLIKDRPGVMVGSFYLSN